MKSIFLFFVISLFIFLIPIILIGLVVRFTSFKIKCYPRGYYLSYFIWMLAVLWVLAAIFHMGQQIFSGLVFFQPRSFHVAWSFSFEEQPYLFVLMAVFYLFLSFVAIISLIKMQKMLEKHFRTLQVDQSGPQ
ncbi:MAG: hypothetical protein PHX60_14425 [Giesbergeria sp.]|uniref:hypothetical protein n=1 Tax=Giesbergeria sp. TaxID=2818473 RepID=UPI002609BDA0|nr:hypothetical protein [Giesbergeria sp.]MDD2610854.1 hypothetical protein [Giesbergeria sp.]